MPEGLEDSIPLKLQFHHFSSTSKVGLALNAVSSVGNLYPKVLLDGQPGLLHLHRLKEIEPGGQVDVEITTQERVGLSFVVLSYRCVCLPELGILGLRFCSGVPKLISLLV